MRVLIRPTKPSRVALQSPMSWRPLLALLALARSHAFMGSLRSSWYGDERMVMGHGAVQISLCVVCVDTRYC